MSTNIIEAKESIDPSSDDASNDLITGPWTEPLDQGGVNYWRCADCGRESLRRGDLRRAEFHATSCGARR